MAFGPITSCFSVERDFSPTCFPDYTVSRSMISLCHYKTKLILLMMNFFCRWAGSRKRKVQSHLRRTRPNVCRDVRLLNENDQPIPIYLLHYYSIPPHPLLLSFYWKKNRLEIFPIDNCIATQIYSVFLLLKKFSYTRCDTLQYFLKTTPSQTFTT